MLPNDVVNLIKDYRDSMEQYDRQRAVHVQLRVSFVFWQIRWRLREDLRYARFLNGAP